ncbi:MAG TPA: dihydropteroate synthase [Steroidobacteraceae bacterium]|jgi:dihydropteroate synthase|nr:dihydropteroate synthase [Steroidobacteraceae bacterium]
MGSSSLLHPGSFAPPALRLQCAGRVLSLEHPLVMGVINVTPDSFSDGGQFGSVAEAVARGEEMVAQGARILDVGGESTRPGATPVELEEELRRVLPVVEGLAGRVGDGAVISVDTSQPQVMRRAADAGARMINDVRALRVPGALEVAAAGSLGICLMHMLGEPATMQQAPEYADVVNEVRDFLVSRVRACLEVGIARERLCVDPGFGFGKRLAHNLQLLRRLDALATLGLPLLVGLSRKSMSGALLALGAGQRPQPAPGQRLAASLALACMARLNGACIIRAHDVAATVDALRVIEAVYGGGDMHGEGN